MSAITVLQARAYQIADESMLALLAAHCLVEDTPKGILLVPLNMAGRRVCHMHHAEDAIQRAFDYLHERGLAITVKGKAGTIAIRVHESKQLTAEG